MLRASVCTRILTCNTSTTTEASLFALICISTILLQVWTHTHSQSYRHAHTHKSIRQQVHARFDMIHTCTHIHLRFSRKSSSHKCINASCIRIHTFSHVHAHTHIFHQECKPFISSASKPSAQTKAEHSAGAPARPPPRNPNSPAASGDEFCPSQWSQAGTQSHSQAPLNSLKKSEQSTVSPHNLRDPSKVAQECGHSCPEQQPPCLTWSSPQPLSRWDS